MFSVVIALMVIWTVQLLAKCISGCCGDLLALGKEGGHNNRTRNAQVFAAEVHFGHVRPYGDGLLVTEGDGL